MNNLLYSTHHLQKKNILKVLTSELQNNIDEKWDACWPINELRPIVILDLISYLFFIKKINENKLTYEKEGNKSDTAPSNSNGNKYFKGSFFIDPDDDSKHSLFSGENDNLKLKKIYSQDLTYGLFIKGDVLMIPTHKLLENAEGIIKIIEEEDHSKGEIFDYLLNKAELTGTNGQAYLTEYLVELIMAIIQPGKKEFILNPAAGNGNLLTGCTKYIARENPGYSLNSGNNFDSRKFVGLESDLTALRIAAMNMILHGIPNPELKIPDTSAPLKDIIAKKPSVIVSNLIFTSEDNKMNVEVNSANEVTSKEIYYLNFILKNFEAGTRAVIIVPDIILYHLSTGFISIRREIVDKCKLDAVLYLGEKKSTHFYGTSVLVFSKEVSAKTDKVWFYKIEHMEMNRNNETIVRENGFVNSVENFSKQRDEFEDILSHFQNKDSNRSCAGQEGFFINVDEIKSRDYILSYKEYHPKKQEKKSIDLSQIISVEKNETINDINPIVTNTKEIINNKTINPKIRLEPHTADLNELINDKIPKSEILLEPLDADSNELIYDKIPENEIPLILVSADTKEVISEKIPESKFPLEPVAIDTKDPINNKTPESEILLEAVSADTKEIIHDKIPDRKIPLEPDPAYTKEVINDKISGNEILLEPVAADAKEVIHDKTPDIKIKLEPLAIDTKEIINDESPESEILLEPFSADTKEVIPDKSPESEIILEPVAADTKEVINDKISGSEILLEPVVIDTKEIINDEFLESEILLEPVSADTKEVINDKISGSEIKLESVAAADAKEVINDESPESEIKLEPVVIDTKEIINDKSPDSESLLEPVATDSNEVIYDKTPDSEIPLEPVAAHAKEVINDKTPNSKIILEPDAADAKEVIHDKIPGSEILLEPVAAADAKEVINDKISGSEILLEPVAVADKKEVIIDITNQSSSRSTKRKRLSPEVPIEKIVFLAGLSILFICIAYLVYWRLNLKNDAAVQKKPASISVATPGFANGSFKTKLVSKQAIDSIVNVINNYAETDSINRSETKYTLISKAYFYSSPDQNTKQRFFINNLDNDTLTPITEKNGFIYVAYINMKGEIIKGWLNKNDLIKVLPATQGDIDGGGGNVDVDEIK